RLAAVVAVKDRTCVWDGHLRLARRAIGAQSRRGLFHDDVLSALRACKFDIVAVCDHLFPLAARFSLYGRTATVKDFSPVIIDVMMLWTVISLGKKERPRCAPHPQKSCEREPD